MDKEMIKYYIISFYSFFLLSCGVDVKTPQVGLVEINGAILESEEIIKNINYFHSEYIKASSMSILDRASGVSNTFDH